MGAPVVTPQGLTLNEETVSQGVAAGLSHSDAWRSAHPDSAASDKTVWEEASHMAARPKVRARIQQLIAASQAAALADSAWDRQRLINAAAEHRELALTGGWRGVGSANGALEIIGRATGVLQDKGQQGPAPVAVTRIIINMPGSRAPEVRQVAEAGYEVLPEAGAEAQS